MSLVLPEQRAIFLHIPKTAGQSIEKALGIEHHHRHHKLNDLPEDWPSYFRFTFVRHPVSRFISACRYNLHVAKNTRRQLEQADPSQLSPTKRFRLHLVRETPDISSIVNDLSLGRLKKLLTFQPQERWCVADDLNSSGALNISIRISRCSNNPWDKLDLFTPTVPKITRL